MSSIFAFLDSISVLAKAAMASMDDIAVGAAKASSKSAAVVIDDAAITPQYVQGISPKRELPVIWRIARGSLINKFFIIIPVAMILSIFAPQTLPFLLILGGSYLVFEGAEKVLEWMKIIKHHESGENVLPEDPVAMENRIVKAAITTDLVLSSEIMLISMASLNLGSNWISLLIALVLIALLMTVVVYGAVGLLIRFDDMGLAVGKNSKAPKFIRNMGYSTAKNMIKVFKVIGVVGVLAMLWVGGHLLIKSFSDIGFPYVYDLITNIAHSVNNGLATWAIDAALSGIIGLLIGVIFTAVFFGVKKVFKKN